MAQFLFWLIIYFKKSYCFCACFGEVDVDRGFGTAFFCGVPLDVDDKTFAFSELSEISLELERISPSICKKKQELPGEKTL